MDTRSTIEYYAVYERNTKIPFKIQVKTKLNSVKNVF